MSLIAVGKIVNVHGIKGVMKVKPYLMNRTHFKELNPFTDKNGKKNFEASIVGQKGDCWLVAIKGITDRTTAENFKGLELYADRNKLPQIQENEFYQCDLVGMRVFHQGQIFGKVTKVLNFGAGDILEIITTDNQILDFSFSKKTFPVIDIPNKQMQIVIPEGMEGTVK